jgi:hypothetical protein
VSRASGIGTYVPHAARQARGRVRVEVYLEPLAASALETLIAEAREADPSATRRDVVEAAILDRYSRGREAK